MCLTCDCLYLWTVNTRGQKEAHMQAASSFMSTMMHEGTALVYMPQVLPHPNTAECFDLEAATCKGVGVGGLVGRGYDA